MWVWALRGSRHFEPMSYSVWPQLPHRGELIIVSLGSHPSPKSFRLGATCSRDAGVLPTISSEEPFLLVLHVPQAYAEMPVGTIERRQAGKATFRCDPFIQLLLPCLIEQYHARRLQH